MNKQIKHISSLSTIMLLTFLTACGDGGNDVIKTDQQTNNPTTPQTEPEESKFFLSPKFALFNANPNGIDVTASNTPRHLWVTDGTSDGTKALSTTLTMINSAQLGGYLDNGKKTIFAAYDTSASTRVIQPYLSDGTASGTTKLKDLVANGNGIDDSVKFTAHKNKVYFNGAIPQRTLGSSVQNPYRLYVTDGTEGGTKEFANSDANSYTNTTTNDVYKIHQNLRLFSDKENLYTTLQTSLLKKQLVKVLPEQTGSAVFEPVTGGKDVALQGMLIINNQPYAMLKYSDGTRPENQLGKITANGIEKTFSTLAFANLALSPTLVLNGGGSTHINDDQYAVFAIENSNLKAIYFKKDGSTQVVTLKQPNNSTFSNHSVVSAYINDKGLYANIKENGGNHTNVVFPINNGVLSDKATLLNTGALLGAINISAHVGNTLVFAGTDTSLTATTCPGTQVGRQLWSITGERTLDRIKVTNAKANTSSVCPSMSIGFLGHVNDNSLLVFQANSGTNNDKGQELWVTDGTAANTKMLKDIAPGSTNATKHGVDVD